MSDKDGSFTLSDKDGSFTLSVKDDHFKLPDGTTISMEDLLKLVSLGGYCFYLKNGRFIREDKNSGEKEVGFLIKKDDRHDPIVDFALKVEINTKCSGHVSIGLHADEWVPVGCRFRVTGEYGQSDFDFGQFLGWNLEILDLKEWTDSTLPEEPDSK